jgi:hypothetical protein
MQTMYLGNQAKGQFRIYDKRAQLGVPGPPLTRVEIAARPNKPARELVGLKNPFDKLKVYDRAKLDLLRDDPTEALFGNRLRPVQPGVQMRRAIFARFQRAI